MLFIDTGGNFYEGQILPGDSVASEAEETAYRAGKSKGGAVLVITQERDAKLAAGVKFGGTLYQTDSAFQVHISGIVTAINAGIIPPGTVVPIRTKGNTIEALTTAQVVGLAGTVLAYVQGVFAESWAAKDAL